MSARAEGSPQGRSRASRQEADARAFIVREQFSEADR